LLWRCGDGSADSTLGYRGVEYLLVEIWQRLPFEHGIGDLEPGCFVVLPNESTIIPPTAIGDGSLIGGSVRQELVTCQSIPVVSMPD